MAIGDFHQTFEENPLTKLTKVDIEGRWVAFSTALARDVKEAVDRPLPKVCVSDGERHTA